jgi:hypothetical protein
MRAATIFAGALALGSAHAWTYPDCELDNCYRNMVDERFKGVSGPLCVKYLAASATAAAAVPTEFSNCAGDYKAVSSACSCITYSMSTTSTSAPKTSSTSTTSTTSTTSSSKVYSSSSAESSSKPTKYTTSTVYTTKVYTVTSCKPEVTDCPSKPHVTTETIAVSTTVCPVTEESSTTVKPTTTTKPTTVGTVTVPATKTTSSALVVTAAAGRVGFELAAAGAALVAALL